MNFIFLLLALGFLGTSVAIDLILYPWFLSIGHWKYLLKMGPSGWVFHAGAAITCTPLDSSLSAFLAIHLSVPTQ
jgi:hypothetical protein